MRDRPRSVVAARTATMLSVCGLAAVAALTGCRDAHAAPAASCAQYPIAWQPAGGAQSAARSDLASLSPGASLQWNPAAGTLTSTTQLSVALPSCTAGHDVATEVYNLIASHPALFQLEPGEWQPPQPYDCQYLGDLEILGMGRQRIAGRPVAKDTFAYVLKRIDGVVHLTGASGTYLPVLGTSVTRAMAACNTLTESAAAATARKTPLHAATYSQCQRTGQLNYTPKASDSLRFRGDEAWTWDDGGPVALRGERVLRVIVDPANYTPELLASDARCPAADGDGGQFTVGFDVTFDVHTGAIVSVKPGLDCIVC